MSADHRALKRAPARVEVSLVEEGHPEPETLGETLDLSLDGLFLLTERRLRVGATMELRLRLSEELHRNVVAKVVRATAEGGGLRLLELDDADLRTLRRVMTDFTRGAPLPERAPPGPVWKAAPRSQVVDPREIHATLTQILRLGIRVTVTPSHGGAAQSGVLRGVGGGVRLKLDSAPTVGVGDVLQVSATMGYTTWRFRAEVEGVTDRVVSVEAPRCLYHSDRRAHGREPVRDETLVVPSLALPTEAEWEVVNRSLGGLAFRTTDPRVRLRAGQELQDARLRVGGVDELLANALIRYTRVTPRPGGTPVTTVGVALRPRR